jgi:hypothetical protein
MKAWWDTWRIYVGHKRNANASLSTDSAAGDASPSSGTRPQQQTYQMPSEPGAIDNWPMLMKKSNTRPLMQGLMIGHDIEAIPPTVYSALQVSHPSSTCVYVCMNTCIRVHM